MPDFNERLAKLADTVRALPDGEKAARELMRLANDIDAYLDDQWSQRNQQDGDFMLKWNEFMNERVLDTHRYHERRLPLVRRNLARKVAADPRWQGGYADALALMADAPPAGGEGHESQT